MDRPGKECRVPPPHFSSASAVRAISSSMSSRALCEVSGMLGRSATSRPAASKPPRNFRRLRTSVFLVNAPHRWRSIPKDMRRRKISLTSNTVQLSAVQCNIFFSNVSVHPRLARPIVQALAKTEATATPPPMAKFSSRNTEHHLAGLRTGCCKKSAVWLGSRSTVETSKACESSKLLTHIVQQLL